MVHGPAGPAATMTGRQLFAAVMRVCRTWRIRPQAREPAAAFLEAPALPRPAQLPSLTLPAINGGPRPGGSLELKPGGQSRRRQRAAGATVRRCHHRLDPPAAGWLCIAVLGPCSAACSLLSGCLRVETDLRFGPPGGSSSSRTLRQRVGRLLPLSWPFSQELQAAHQHRNLAGA